ncbi:aldehyde dehydrogenase family protein, partial [Enterobacter sp. BH2-YP2023]|uniref:aldehyde dehydrogenase family protein n=1 Tax=Enterobacter sp. BH2-YP2023 TaxID=3402818 RepID=UPI003D72C6E9
CPADDSAQDVAWRHGISLDGHVARRLTRNLMQGADLILVMEPEHLRFIAAMAPESRGAAIGAQAGAALKKCVLELGGSDPFIVLNDADLDLAVNAAVAGRYQNTGQVCAAAKR